MVSIRVDVLFYTAAATLKCAGVMDEGSAVQMASRAISSHGLLHDFTIPEFVHHDASGTQWYIATKSPKTDQKREELDAPTGGRHLDMTFDP